MIINSAVIIMYLFSINDVTLNTDFTLKQIILKQIIIFIQVIFPGSL